jgi:hypothetical protein
MSVALEYEAIGSVPDGVRARIRECSVRGTPRGGWWAEGLAFVDPQDPIGPLVGSTKLMLLRNRDVDVPPELDMAMALRDGTFIVRRLSWWSFRYRLRWDLAIEGKELGQIRSGIPTWTLLWRILQLSGIVRVLSRTPFLFVLRRRALRQHPDRWSEDPPGTQTVSEREQHAPWALKHHQAEAQRAFKEGRFADVLTSLSIAEQNGELSVLSQRYRALALKRPDKGSP